MYPKIQTIDDVSAWQLCCGCGACAYVCPNEIEMIDTLEYGRRPRSKGNSSPDNSRLAMRICPGIELSHQSFNSETIPELRQAWGQVLEVWEGYATDPEIDLKVRPVAWQQL